MLTRRDLLQVGSLGFLGLGLPELFQARQTRAGDGISAQETSCLFVVQYGGASQIDTFDPKPAAPEEIRGPYAPIATNVPGLQLTDMLPRLARLADCYTLVRSMTHATSDHNGGMHVCMTGHSKPTERTPYFGSSAAKLRPSRGNLPSYVWLQNLAGDVVPWYTNGGYLGAAYAPWIIGKEEANAAHADFRVQEFDPPEGITNQRRLDQSQLLGRLAGVAATTSRSPATDEYRQFQLRALDLLTGEQARRAFDLNQEPDVIRDRYGRHAFGQNLLMARRLIEAGVRLVTVNAWCGRASTDDVLATQGWDHHGAAIQRCGIFDTGTFGLGFVLPRFDEALSALLDDLRQRGLLETTLVVVVGEFGRTPRIASNPYPGRDHWPQCYSALLAGAGIRGGVVFGSSDKHGALVASRPVSPEDFGATLFHALGIPPATRFGPDGFSLRVSDGEPILDLFG
jgi:hypothetical protein